MPEANEHWCYCKHRAWQAEAEAPAVNDDDYITVLTGQVRLYMCPQCWMRFAVGIANQVIAGALADPEFLTALLSQNVPGIDAEE